MNYNILPLIIESKKKKIALLKDNKKGILSLLKKAPKVRSFKDAINHEGKVSLITELKQASPSKGVIRKVFSPCELAGRMASGGAKALSILTEEEFFLGKSHYIEEVREEVDLPILRKDFILDESQVMESRALGADAILLIIRILDEKKFAELHACARELGMDVLVEVHTEKELRKVLKYPVEIIGINNRNLQTLKVDLATTKKIAPFVPKNIVTVSESGISSQKDMLVLKGLGINAVLVGAALMRNDDLESKMKELNIDG